MLLRSMDSQLEEDGKCQEDKGTEAPNPAGDLPKGLDEEVTENLSAVPVEDHHLRGEYLETQPKLLSTSEEGITKIAPPIPEDHRYLERDYAEVEAEPLIIIPDPDTGIVLEDQLHEAEPESASDAGITQSETLTPAQDREPTFEVANGTTFADPIQFWSEDQDAAERDLVPDEPDSDSALGSDTQSETTSLTESIWHFRMEHGRTYHAYKDGKYIFPNDEREADRLDMQHHLLRLTYGQRLFFSPLNNPKRCVDIGTGTGIWAMDFADEFPGCEVLGVDLSPNQPSFVPPNLKFVVDDAEDLWLYEQKFDFIHLSLMAGCFADWPKFFRQAYDNLEPGGWLELQDYGLPVRSKDGTHRDTDVHRWGELLCEAGRNMGRPLGDDCYENYPRWMTEAGFVDIHVQMYMWPINGWPKNEFMKEIGRWNQINILEGLEGFCLALLTRGLGWKKEEVDVFVAKVSNDLRDKRIHAYFPMPVTWGRKPLPGEVPFV